MVSSGKPPASNSVPLPPAPSAPQTNAAAKEGGSKPAAQAPSEGDLASAPKPSMAVSAASSSVGTSIPTTEPNANLSFADQMRAVPLPAELAKLVTWQPGEPVPYSAVVATLDEVSQRPGRLEKETTLSNLFRCILATTPGDLEAVTYIAFNQVHPVYDGLELGVGDSLLIKAVCEATGRKKDVVEEDYEREGDLGVVALASRSSQKTLSFAIKPKLLTASQVLEQFRAITLIKGDKAQARKVELMKGLLVRCQGQEAKYIVRALQGKLRIGLAEQTVLVSLSHAFLDTQQGLRMDATSPTEKGPLARQDDEDELVDSGDEGDTKRAPASTPVPTSGSTPTTKMEVVGNDDSMQCVLNSDEQSLEKLLAQVRSHETPEAHALRLHLTNQTRLSKSAAYEYAEIAVKRAFSECPNLSLLLAALVSGPLFSLHESVKLRIGVPVAPMLAKPTKQIGDVLTRLQGLAFTMEYKYDGERAQVHLLDDGTVKIFSRNSEDNTEKYADLREIVHTAVVPGVTSLIVDAEVVAYDREKGQLLPFQVLSTRKRKTAEDEEQKVKVILQVFDLLYLNHQSLLRESLRLRRALLQKVFVHTESLLHFASGFDHVENGDTAPIEAFLAEACAAQCEGLMVKTLDSKASYEPSKRSLNWLKLKKDYITGMGVCDSVDLVPIGAYYGRGKRVSTYGAYLMACYDPDRDEYQSVCKVGTGFKDEDLERLSNRLKEAVVRSKKKPVNYNVSEVLYPDEWFEPSVVWELQAADLSRSSVHRGGVGRIDGSGNTTRGIGLRFPRFLRERDDKKPEQATTSEQVVDMFYSQGSVENAKEEDDDDDEGI